MFKLKEILRLKYEAHLSLRQIALSLSLSVGVVFKYLQRAEAADLSWPLPADLSEQALKKLMQPPRAVFSNSSAMAEPDFEQIAAELKQKGMTRQLLWEEYAETFPDNHYSYSRFTVLFRQWRQKQQLSMRQTHRAGEKLFVDYCGPTLPVVNPDSSEIREAQVFVAVLGASSYTYAEATWSQALPDWIGSHIRSFEFFQGVPQIVVPDNLRSAVNKACRYDPVINPSYAQMAHHYGVAVIPARPYKPKDKSKAEVGVQLVERWIMMRLRKQVFYTLASLNIAIRLLLDELNRRPFKKRSGSRLSQYQQIDQPALKPLEAACQRAQHIGGMQYQNIASILSKSLDKLPLENDSTEPTTLPLLHDNVRGPGYYH